MSGTEAAAGSYRTCTIKRRERRTRAQVEQLDRQILAVLQEDHPQSIRHLFYRMTDPRLSEPVPKTDKGAGNGYRAVQHRCVELRRAGELPYGWIVDATRRGYFTPTYKSVDEFLLRVKGLFRADLWTQSDYHCEVWVESRSIAGIVQRDCKELAVSLYPCGGFSSISLAYEAAEDINDADDGREVVIFYIGDYDPSGVLIDIALERELRRHLDPDIRLKFARIGITKEQITEYDLPTKPRKEGDNRALHVTETVEAEAMPAHVMRALLRERIEALLPERALAVARAAEESERAQGRIVELAKAARRVGL
jgi:hypothetical protein